MADYEVKTFGFKEFERAIKRNPGKVKDEVAKFLVRAIAIYKSGIMNSPWRKGSSGGGAPVDTGYLRDSHQAGTKIMAWKAYIGPASSVKYARYVHEGTKRMKARPWLDYVKDKKEIQRDYFDKDKGLGRELYEDTLRKFSKCFIEDLKML